MTPSMLKTIFEQIHLADSTRVYKDIISQNVVVDLGSYKICGNRKEDFEALAKAANAAIALFETT